jgi:hypothetical protein
MLWIPNFVSLLHFRGEASRWTWHPLYALIFVDLVKIRHENVALEHCEDARDEERTTLSYVVGEALSYTL